MNPFAYLSNPTKLHLMAHCLLIAWQSLAGAAPPPAQVMVWSDGQVYRDNVLEPGFPFVSSRRTWAEFAKMVGHVPGIFLHNPMGNLNLAGQKVMQFDQAQELADLTAAEPLNTDLAARADLAAFTAAFANRPAKQWLAIYVGGIKTLEPLPDETSKQHAERAYAALSWAREACPNAIGLDATKGEPVVDHPLSRLCDGPYGSEWRLIKMLQRDGILVLCEPARLTISPRLDSCGAVYQENWLLRAITNKFALTINGQQVGTFVDPRRAVWSFRLLDMRGKDATYQAAHIAEVKQAGEIPAVHYYEWPGGWQ